MFYTWIISNTQDGIINYENQIKQTITRCNAVKLFNTLTNTNAVYWIFMNVHEHDECTHVKKLRSTTDKRFYNVHTELHEYICMCANAVSQKKKNKYCTWVAVLAAIILVITLGKPLGKHSICFCAFKLEKKNSWMINICDERFRRCMLTAISALQRCQQIFAVFLKHCKT